METGGGGVGSVAIMARRPFEKKNLESLRKKIRQIVAVSLFQLIGTGKSLSEALILTPTNPQYDNRLFIELRVSSVHENSKLRTCCVHTL